MGKPGGFPQHLPGGRPLRRGMGPSPENRRTKADGKSRSPGRKNQGGENSSGGGVGGTPIFSGENGGKSPLTSFLKKETASVS